MSALIPARPTLGFETKRAAIIHLHGKGYPIATIAHDVGSTPHSVASALAQSGLRPHHNQIGSRNNLVSGFLELSPELMRLLRPHAARRGLTCAALAAQIIDTVVTSDLIDATLDDREG